MLAELPKGNLYPKRGALNKSLETRPAARDTSTHLAPSHALLPSVPSLQAEPPVVTGDNPRDKLHPWKGQSEWPWVQHEVHKYQDTAAGFYTQLL